MQVEHVVVSSEEITQIEEAGDSPHSLLDRGQRTIPKWAAIALSVTVLALPLLCVLTVVSRISLRTRPLYVKYAWMGFLSTLLVISALLNSVAAVVFLSLPRMPAVLSTNLPDLDERGSYPRLPLWTNLDSSEVSFELKPLVIVVSPTNRIWDGQKSSAVKLGAGVLLLANQEGYLFATAKHVTGAGESSPRQVMVSTASGVRASADVVATADKDDLALLWVNRHSGRAAFTQPIDKTTGGESFFVIGHPEGLSYAVSTGTVSGLRGGEVRMTGAISPGYDGGPVYDIHGNLVGIVSSGSSDPSPDANGEDPGFATVADVLREKSGWTFAGGGEHRLQQYIQALDDR